MGTKMDDLQYGNELFQQRARKTLPYLVRQAKAGQKRYYSDVAKEIGIPNARNLNHILGLIGDSLIDLGKIEKVQIPPIQCLVVSKSTELPGDGITYFISTKKFNTLTKTEKHKVVNIQLTDIFTYKKWDWILMKLGLKPILFNLNKELQNAKKYKSVGESIHHKKLKEFIANNPSVLGLKNIEKGKTEYSLPSADKIDVVFDDNGLRIGIEVKSFISDVSDILRGLFQCVKYKYLIEAEQTIKDEFPNSKVILAIQCKLPKELQPVKNLLGIEVIENIKIKI